MTPQLTLLKRLAGKLNFYGLALLTIPLAVSMTACNSQVDLATNAEKLASRETTMGKDVVLFPDAVPSTADGAVYWKQGSCAECHGADGKGVSGKTTVDLTNVEWMRRRKPLDQFKLISFGQGDEVETPNTSALGTTEENELESAGRPVRHQTHEPYLEKLTKRQRWDVIFYSRSLASPLLSAEERLAMKAVFGANCAVCHGSRGAGDGNLNKGLVLQPAPANFTQFDRFYDRTDDQIWDHIANGIKWEGMPNFLGKQDRGNKVTFDADYIWKLVQYVRNFHEDSAPVLEGPKKAKLQNGETNRPVANSTTIEEKNAPKALSQLFEGKGAVDNSKSVQ